MHEMFRPFRRSLPRRLYGLKLRTLLEAFGIADLSDRPEYDWIFAPKPGPSRIPIVAKHADALQRMLFAVTYADVRLQFAGGPLRLLLQRAGALSPVGSWKCAGVAPYAHVPALLRALKNRARGFELDGTTVRLFDGTKWRSIDIAGCAVCGQAEREAADVLCMTCRDCWRASNDLRMIANPPYNFTQLEALFERKGAIRTADLRPKTAEDVVGQQAALRSISVNFASPFPQHLLLCGPPGTGKTTLARLAHRAAVKQRALRKGAPFVEIDASTVYIDERNGINDLVGWAMPPVYETATARAKETHIPDVHLGAAARAHGGVLFIDEIGELTPYAQNLLLKVLEDRTIRFRVPIPSAADLTDVERQIFQDGLPANFILIGATTRDPRELSPALVSRCRVVRLRPLSAQERRQIVTSTAARANLQLAPRAAEILAMRSSNGREAIGALMQAAGYARMEGATLITEMHLDECAPPSDARIGLRG